MHYKKEENFSTKSKIESNEKVYKKFIIEY